MIHKQNNNNDMPSIFNRQFPLLLMCDISFLTFLLFFSFFFLSVRGTKYINNTYYETHQLIDSSLERAAEQKQNLMWLLRMIFLIPHN